MSENTRHKTVAAAAASGWDAFVIVVGMLKGGTGKTTTAWFIALYYAVVLGIPTLLLDADASSQSTYDWFKVTQAAGFEIPANLVVERYPFDDIAEYIRTKRAEFGAIMVDAGGGSARIFHEAVTEANLLLVRSPPPRSSAASSWPPSTRPWGRPITPEDRTDLCVFVAFQYVRGLRKRREIELMSDFYVRIMRLNDPVGAGRQEVAAYRDMLRDFRTLEVASHPNEHVSLLGKLAEPLSDHLLMRPLTVMQLTEGSLLTCDEPIVTFDDAEDTPDPVIPQARRRTRSRRRRGQRAIRQTKTLIQVQSTRNRGLARVDEIVMPVDRRTLLVFSHPTAVRPSHLRMTAKESREAAEEVNERIRAQAYFMAFGHPDDRLLLADPLPDVGPLALPPRRCTP